MTISNFTYLPQAGKLFKDNSWQLAKGSWQYCSLLPTAFCQLPTCK